MKNKFNPAAWEETEAFIKAAGEGNDAAVRKFMDKHGNAINQRSAGWTALMKAANKGHRETAELLLENGALLDEALISAAKGGHDDIIKLLLEHGADVNEESLGGWTALMMAAGFGHPATVELLLKGGADIDKEHTGGETALLCAERNKQSAAAAVLKEWPDKEARARAAAVAEFSPALKRDLPALRPLMLRPKR